LFSLANLAKSVERSPDRSHGRQNGQNSRSHNNVPNHGGAAASYILAPNHPARTRFSHRPVWAEGYNEFFENGALGFTSPIIESFQRGADIPVCRLWQARKPAPQGFE